MKKIHSLVVILIISALLASTGSLLNAQTALDSLPPVDSLGNPAVVAWTQQLGSRAEAFKLTSQGRLQTVVSEREALDSLIVRIKADSTADKSVLDSLGNRLKEWKLKEKEYARQLKKAEKTVAQAAGCAALDTTSQRKALPALWKSVNELVLIANTPGEETRVAVARPAKPEKKKSVPEEPAKPVLPGPAVAAQPQKPAAPAPIAVAKYNPAADVMLNPPAIPCNFEENSRDELSGAPYRRTAAAEWFRHAPAPLKGFLQGRPNVRCEAALSAIGPRATLLLTFTVVDPNPRKSFGKLPKDAPATLWFMDGTSLELYNSINDEGVINYEDQSYTFRGRYPVEEAVWKKIRRTDLDRIRITWGSGYEEYDIQYVHLLRQLSRCFE
ncbi:MAG: hypothetical protein ACKOZV_14910 [Bacteroidota bacterium]